MNIPPADQPSKPLNSLQSRVLELTTKHHLRPGEIAVRLNKTRNYISQILSTIRRHHPGLLPEARLGRPKHSKYSGQQRSAPTPTTYINTDGIVVKVFPPMYANGLTPAYCKLSSQYSRTPRPDARSDRYQSLWVAVITQAIMDSKSNSTNAESRFAKMAANNWLFDHNRDFDMVCDLAGFNSDYTRRMIKESFARGFEWRAHPGEGERYEERKAYRDRFKHHPIDEE